MPWIEVMDLVILQIRQNRIEGYCDLEMWEDAQSELRELGTLMDRTLKGRELRLRVLMGLRSWLPAGELAMELAGEFPTERHWFTHGAYCLHELGRTQEAREFLMTGPPSLREDPLFYYNLACYECVLGEIETAKLLLQQAFERDQSLRELARSDADLAAMFQ